MMKTITLALLISTLLASTACAENLSSDKAVAGKLAQLDNDIRNKKFKQITSVLIKQDGETTYENYWGDGNTTLLNDTRSAMKTLTAMAVGAAIADGKISGVDAHVFAFFEKERPFRFSSTRKDEITIKDLLTMSSALDCNDNDWDSPGNEEHMHPARNWTYFVVDLPTKDDYKRDAAGRGPMVYCTAASFLLGQIVERATGERVDNYIARRLLNPMGIEKIKWDSSPSGEIMTGGGAETSSRNLLKLGELLRNDGKFGDRELLPKHWVDDMVTIQVKANDNQDYGYQIWREDFPCGSGSVSAWYMGGNGGNKIVVIKELDLTAVITATLYGTRGMHQQSADILKDYILADHPGCKT